VRGVLAGRPADTIPRVLRLRPESARWVADAGLFLLPYDAVRTEPAPAMAILEFLESTYEACATGLGWSRELVSVEVPAASAST
jgi:hypothetical protein